MPCGPTPPTSRSNALAQAPFPPVTHTHWPRLWGVWGQHTQGCEPHSGSSKIQGCSKPSKPSKQLPQGEPRPPMLTSSAEPLTLGSHWALGAASAVNRHPAADSGRRGPAHTQPCPPQLCWGVGAWSGHPGVTLSLPPSPLAIRSTPLTQPPLARAQTGAGLIFLSQGREARSWEGETPSQSQTEGCALRATSRP